VSIVFVVSRLLYPPPCVSADSVVSLHIRSLVVDVDSASPPLPGVTYYGIEATHSGLCKFGSASAPGYRTVSTALWDWAGEGPHVINIRWAVEDEDRRARARQEIHERAIPFVSAAIYVPLMTWVVSSSQRVS